ncbi:general secretion pathway protein GspB [Shewanella hanedai]|uniref:General secretion pathway protein GspB n=1 Tax=Shewanella hanedai TaxID=25 RepID=A0A553JJ78_SHEHA|nr:general secretion pathway protein GspB [Shewanella hanedai]TRY12496.1 general secretion pathway protein GspB [Shewanella hanedai]GGI95690.1 general secretion pathway protein GspB [Shewanella hanedai]
MSILLDAVTRAKQQDLNIHLDPVLTPRAQYDQLQKTKNSGLLLLLSGIIISLLVVIIWLGRSQFMSTEVNVEPEKSAAVLVSSDTDHKEVVQTKITVKPVSGVQLAGKVALPLAATMPVRYQAPIAPQTAPVTRTVTSQSPNQGSDAIVLGAHANHKGQELLASLKSQVNSAAEDVGLRQTTSTPEPKQSQSKAETKPRDYQSERNLLAAFEAALKEVEVSNSVATPVTAEKLDPIPTPEQDSLPKYGQLPAVLQLQVPEFNINAHVYSSDPNNRWLNVDGAELQQGDKIGGKLEIVEIRPRDVVLSIQGTEFKVPAI